MMNLYLGYAGKSVMVVKNGQFFELDYQECVDLFRELASVLNVSLGMPAQEQKQAAKTSLSVENQAVAQERGMNAEEIDGLPIESDDSSEDFGEEPAQVPQPQPAQRTKPVELKQPTQPQESAAKRVSDRLNRLGQRPMK